MGDYGLKVTRPGYDVATATILQQEFNSSHNCLKMFLPESFTSTASGSRDYTVNHALGYKPAFLAFYEVAASGRWYAYGSREDYSGASCTLFIYATDDDIVFRLYSSNSKAIKVAYRLFVDPGE